MEIDFALINEVESFKEDYQQDYLAIIEETTKQLNIDESLELSCILVDDQKIHDINNEYRKIDRSTDVISFALEDSEQYKMQAEEYGHSLKREMCFLFTHGLLHLLGYDHIEKDDEEKMLRIQKSILEALGIGR